MLDYIKKLSLICIFLSSPFFSLRAIDGLKFENITNKNGLSHNTVRSIMQDTRGFIWFSTINGLNRYDGREFVVMLPQFNSYFFNESKIKKTVEDRNGRIWVLSTSGLVDCYDTHTESFVNYNGRNKPGIYLDIQVMSNGDVWLWGKKEGACRIRYEADKQVVKLYDMNSIQTNNVNFVFEDSERQIWLGTDRELYRIDQGIPEYCLTGDDNLNFQHANESGKYIYFFTWNNRIIIVDKNRKTYVGKIDIPFQEGIFIINHTAVLNEDKILVAGKQGTYLLHTDVPEITSAKEIFDNEELKGTRILFDNKGDPWIYNKSGIIRRYEKTTQTFKQIELIPPFILPVIDLERYDIWVDSRGIAWITTYGNGLFALEPDTGILTHFTRYNSGLKTNYLLSVFEDRSGEIWVGTEHTGITKISLTKYRNDIFFPDPDKSNPENKIIRTIYQDKSGDIWIGTKSGNIYVFDENFHPENMLPLSQGMPYCITEDNRGNKWIGTKGNGLLIFSEHTTGYRTYVHNPFDTTSLSNNSIYSILIDSMQNTWIGTFGGGLLYVDKSGEDLTFKRLPGIDENQKFVRCLLQDKTGKIWVGGNNGIVIFESDRIFREPDHLQRIYFDQSNSNSLNHNEVKCIFEDSSGQIWIGTSGGGLNLALRNGTSDEFRFIHYTSEDGLVNDVVQSIEEDDNRNLWISTESGVSKFNLDTKTFENYNFADTWESDLFCESSSFKRRDGKLMFGSYNGMYILDPATFINDFSELPVLLTKLFVNGITVIPGGTDSPLSKSITETESIRLKHGQNSFSIEFSSLNFSDEHSGRYTYILENYDKEWNPITQYNVATYKNVPTGNYIFRVKGSNRSGVMVDRETVLEIIVVPPFWKSSKAIAIYIMLVLMVCFFAGKLIVKMNNLNNAVEVERRLTEYRLRFFTNISHEFRTPLTIIKGSIENMSEMSPLPSSLKKQVDILEKSASRLMRLIDQLLEFRKIQKEELELIPEKTEAVGFFADIYNMFIETAERNNVHYTFSSNKDSAVILMDRGKMDKVAFNLLSNAFKHTPKNGNIFMKLYFDDENNHWQLIVSDSGIGIPADKRSLLFQRFKQINYSKSGIGIGLNLTYEFVNMHRGQIEYADSEWGGASFIVTVPMDESIYSQETANSHPLVSIESEEITETIENNDLKETSKIYKILIIEDDEEIRSFLNEQLKNSFTVLTSSNGSQGLEIANKEQPDLIICDIMMPEMNGFDVTKNLKSNFHSSHIPIILLTAHSSIEHQVEGIEAGADAYIVKPFSTKYLMARIVKLIEQREKLQHKFSQEPGLGLTTISTTDKDKQFIEKIHAIIEKNLDNSEFSVETFAQAVHLGRTMLYKKVKGITGYSPNEYVRVIRLKRAAELLRTTDLNVSEIAYKVGFNDPFYFSRCFKEQFSLSPIQFRAGKE